MKRFAVAIVVVLLAVAAGWWLWPADEPSGDSSREAVTVAASSPPVPVGRSGSLSGRVERDGKPVAKARVSARAGAGSTVAFSGELGEFVFDGLVAGSVYLSASTDDAASAVEGPYFAEAGRRVEGVVLRLMAPVQVEGTVVNLVTRAPLRGASVISSNSAGKTDESGRFVLRGAPTQTWLDVSAPGYLSRTEWVSLELSRRGARIEVALEPSSLIEGLVSEGGVPVAGATVWGELVQGGQRGASTATVLTDPTGRFRLETAQGLVRLGAATPRGTRVRGPELRIAIGEHRKNVVLDAAEATWLDGTVTRDGAPLPAAQVSVVEAGSEAVVATAVTGVDGHFRVGSLQTGRYVAQVHTAAFAAVAGPFEHRGDGAPWAIALTSGGVIEGRVVPPGAGTRVRWRSGDWSGPPADTVTDVEGRFRFEGIPSGLVSLDAEGPAGAATVRAKAGDQVVLTLQLGEVVVHVQDDSGAALSDAVLSARSLETGAVERHHLLAPDGVLRLSLPPGWWELLAEVPGRGRSSAARLQVSSTPVEVRLSLEAAIEVSGVVRDAATRLPISGARVTAWSPGEANQFRVAVVTDARGDFELPPMSRSASVEVLHPQFRPSWKRALDAAGGRLEFLLTPAPNQPSGESPWQFEGVGMVLNQEGQRIFVAQVNEGGPAERAGVVSGDSILAVDGVPALPPIEQVVSRIRGPAGTPVRILFERGGRQFELALRRRLLNL